MIEFTINAKPQPKKYRIIAQRVKSEQNGYHAVKCDCGANFAAFHGDDSKALQAFRGIVSERAASVMDRDRLTMIAGPVELAVTIYVQRPQSHYVGGDRRNALKVGPWEKTPSGVDSMGILEAVRTALTGVAFRSRAQVERPIATPLYDEMDSIRIRVKPYRASECDARNNQPELF